MIKRDRKEKAWQDIRCGVEEVLGAGEHLDIWDADDGGDASEETDGQDACERYLGTPIHLEGPYQGDGQ
jgi:hypothetical protein